MPRNSCRRRTSFDYLVTGGRVGDAVSLTVWRDRQEVELELTLQVYIYIYIYFFFWKLFCSPKKKKARFVPSPRLSGWLRCPRGLGTPWERDPINRGAGSATVAPSTDDQTPRAQLTITRPAAAAVDAGTSAQL
jgi:hypothetical protein